MHTHHHHHPKNPQWFSSNIFQIDYIMKHMRYRHRQRICMFTVVCHLRYCYFAFNMSTCVLHRNISWNIPTEIIPPLCVRNRHTTMTTSVNFIPICSLKPSADFKHFQSFSMHCVTVF